ncbi:hypothetical protein SRB5_45540 [Streptomyces sp. RB5]|uniref:TolB-like translocation protein n=1 Tax=Streptomyces smaragdinus TaxID=2585196 RepID=A0A7K0CLM0_9ACTN|nr:PD40 domain-containing protein [Streptomyces smaragdinus]MQY14388.1 hypothetical protein [Streptomyces smaragdinus]
MLVVAVVVLGGVAAGFVLYAVGRAQDANRPRAGGPAFAAGTVALTDAGRMVVRSTAPGPHRDELVSVPAGDPDGVRTVSGVRCERWHAAAGTGVCLQTEAGILKPTHRARILDARLRTVRTYDLAGVPSRARVSPSGRFVAWTVFVSGESYSSAYFTTRTSVLDTRSGKLAKNLEDFTVVRDGKRVRAADANFWGVTFAKDDDTFYATFNTARRTYLVRGSVRERRMTTLHENVECPSLSPDGTRIAYKKRVMNGASLWREHVLDLRTMRETPLAERRSVDDQAVWLDNDTVAYAIPAGDRSTDLWTTRADGSGKPRKLMTGAFNPVLRGSPAGPR